MLAHVTTSRCFRLKYKVTIAPFVMTKLISILVLLSLFVLFIIQNASTIEINFLLWQLESSRAIVLILVFLSGLLSGVLSMLYLGRHRRKSTSLPPIRYS